MNPFQSLKDYEKYVYTLKQHYPLIKDSNLIVIRRGKRTAILQGEIRFATGFRVLVKERLSFDIEAVAIESYGYEIWNGEQKSAWYDSQPHPNDPELETTNPHHKHIQPDIKHNRVPAPNMSFEKPNLNILIEEVSSLLKNG